MSNVQFGAGAIHTPESEARFNQRRNSIIAYIQPANIIEKLLTEELLRANAAPEVQ